jgi:RNA-splicing ligase RtcB
MPDCHAGAGCVIGTTMIITDKVCPNIVGVDIGCGVLTSVLGFPEIDFNKLDDFIKKNIPSGFSINSKPSDYANGLYESLICSNKIGNKDRIIKSIGTLGGGNHFIEIDKDDDNCYYLLVHTGSRNLGLQVAKYYQDLATKNHSYCKDGKTKLISDLKAMGRENEIAIELKKYESEHQRQWPEELDYLSGNVMSDYLHDMVIAQEYAEENRKEISLKIVNHLGVMIRDWFDTVHNYIDIPHRTLRKGAVSAKMFQRLIIPINMRDGALICTGKGNIDWNESAPHGAGRILSRSQARKELNENDFKKSMEGIYTTTATIETIDESPMAYKPIDEIIHNIGETVEIINRIYPVYNFKATD